MQLIEAVGFKVSTGWGLWFQLPCFLVRALGTSWNRGVGRISLVRLCLEAPAVGYASLRCVWPIGGSPSPLTTQQKWGRGMTAQRMRRCVRHVWHVEGSCCLGWLVALPGIHAAYVAVVGYTVCNYMMIAGLYYSTMQKQASCLIPHEEQLTCGRFAAAVPPSPPAVLYCRWLEPKRVTKCPVQQPASQSGPTFVTCCSQQPQLSTSPPWSSPAGRQSAGRCAVSHAGTGARNTSTSSQPPSQLVQTMLC
jgi:hypothetical protein